MSSKIVEKDFINDLYLFYRYFIASNYKDSVPAPHIHKLANKLMALALNDDGKHRLAVSMPPSAFEEFYGYISISAMVVVSRP